MDNKEIYDALMTLKECCKNSKCTRCPLSVGKNPYKCKVSDNVNGLYPKNWQLNSNFDYKAFEK